MITPTPFHELTVRVYYEDTDFSGRVYHASYIRFMERGRTEWLRALSYEHGALAGEQHVVFAVRRLEIDYLAPAVIDDLLRGPGVGCLRIEPGWESSISMTSPHRS